MSDENGPDDTSGTPEEEEHVEETRRVRPLFRFGRKNSKNAEKTEVGNVEDPEPDDEEEAQGPVRPVRVVKFIPTDNNGSEDEVGEEETPFEETEVVSEAPFEETMEEEEEPFVFEEEQPFTVVEKEEPFAVDEESIFTEVDDTPPVPFEAIDETVRAEPVHDSISVQEEAETEEEFQFRSEETPATFETIVTKAPTPAVPTPRDEEARPNYHKYLKPDEELLQRKQATGPATGFDRDMDAEAGEIDFGIDLIDPNERRKKRKTPPRKDETGPKKGVGGHDSDGEVVTTQSGADIGVDFQKRRKRRL
ncbi:MAG: hypothetical protein LN414_02405 [Candidatus Thermoplasmatota archaeon]|nr:hypothetical protein [Candidatus Thermoplasmatota archaeon]